MTQNKISWSDGKEERYSKISDRAALLSGKYLGHVNEFKQWQWNDVKNGCN